MKTVEERIMEILSSQIRMDRYNMELNDDTDLMEDLATDSILMMQIVASLESEFDIEFDYDLDDDILRNVGKLKAYIKDKINEN